MYGQSDESKLLTSRHFLKTFVKELPNKIANNTSFNLHQFKFFSGSIRSAMFHLSESLCQNNIRY